MSDNVLIVIPLYTGIHERTLRCLNLLQHSRASTSDILMLRGGDEHIDDPKTRIAWKYNQARRAFLAGNYDWMLTVEHDIICEPDALERMIAACKQHNAAVGYALYCFRQPPWYRWSVFPTMDERTYTGQSLSFYPERARAAWGQVIDVSGEGNGFTLIRRDVLEHIHYRTERREGGNANSQDVYFAFDAKRAGFKQIGHLGIRLGHIDIQNGAPRVIWPDIDAPKLHRIEERLPHE